MELSGGRHNGDSSPRREVMKWTAAPRSGSGSLEVEFLRVNGNLSVCLQTSETGSEGSGHALSYELSERACERASVDGRNKAPLSFVSTEGRRSRERERERERYIYNASVLIKTDRSGRTGREAYAKRYRRKI